MVSIFQLQTGEQISNLEIPIRNASFEDGTLGYWTYEGDGSVTIDSAVHNVGSYSARIDVDANSYMDFWNTGVIPTRSRKTIQSAAYIKQDGNVDKVYMLVRFLSADKLLLTNNIAVDAIDKSFTPTTSFVSYLRETYAPPGAVYCQIGVRVYATASAAQCWVDDFALPSYPPPRLQFYFESEVFTPQYIAPGETLTLHQSAAGEVGEVIGGNITINSLSIPRILLTTDNVTYTASTSLLEHQISPNNLFYLETIDESAANASEYLYSIIINPASFLPYNYRVSLALENPTLLEQERLNENLGAGDDTTTTFSGNLANTPVTGVSIISGVVDGSGNITLVSEHFKDNGDGTLTGSAGGTGTINYTTGAYSVTFNTAPPTGYTILANYQSWSANTTSIYLHHGAVYKRIWG